MDGSIISLFDKQDIKAFRKLKMRKKRKKEEMESLKKDVAIDDHLIPIDEFYERYQTNPEKGLTNDDAMSRLLKYGPNLLTPPKTTSQFVVFLNHLFSGFAIILWVSGSLCLVAYGVQQGTQENPDKNNVYLACIIFLVVIITAFFGFAQDRTSSKIMDSFKKMITPTAVVIRDGKASTIPSEYLVKGDVVLIKFGDKVPADIRIVENFGMKVDNSSLTGETDPQPRGTEVTSENLMETQNVAFYSSNVMEGTCKGVVFETGDKTVIGRLATLTIGLTRDESPMTKEIRYFIKLITIVSIVFSVVFTIIALALSYSVTECIIYFIAFMVANIPEGLLVTVTLSLTLAAKKMAKRNCLIKSLDSVETLGSTSTICSDKTGTLTQNRMTVHEIMFNYKLHQINYSSDRNTTENEDFNRNDPDFLNLMRCGRLCLRADFEDQGNAAAVLDKVVDGDASEAAILKCVECIFGKVHEYRRNNHKLFEVPFNSNNKYQLSIHRCGETNVLCMKGAPETILSLCNTISVNGRDVSLTPDMKERIEKILHLLGSKGERVLGFCDRELPDDSATKVYDPAEKNYPTRDLRFLGLMALIDPPREAVPEAVAKCKTAGIRVIMVTGDHPVTAEAIAREVGIISGYTRNDAAKKLGVSPKDVPQSAVSSHSTSVSTFILPRQVNAIVVPGDKLRQFTNDELDQVLVDHDEIVFARTTPTQKLQIVEGCQRLGYITAVTGDGVNDSPALKKADIGVAMGIAGSEVSKQAADMILLDDNFASIVVGVEQGRIIFDNLKKSIAYVLTSNIPEMAPFIAYIVFSVPLPLSVIAILIVDVGTDMLPAIALAYERAESDIMKRKPRNPFVDKMVNRRLIWMTYGQIGIIQTVGAFTAYFLVMAQHGFFPSDIIGIRSDWENPSEIVTDSFGQEWGYDQRRFLEHYCQSCFLAAIIVTQIADALICKTRRNSLFQQGMSNWPLNVGLIFALVLGGIMLYTPGLYQILLLPPIRLIHWLPGIPFALLIIIYDEIRRLIIRHRPGGWVDREFYY